jgi:hypothetical protein
MFCLSDRNKEKRRRKGLGLVQPRLSSVWHTGLSGGAPDSVRCARRASDELATLGNVWRRTAIIHRTVRWCTGLSGGAPDCPVSQRPPAQRSAAQSTGDAWPAPTVDRGHQTVWCAPDTSGQCPVRQLPRRCNGHLRQIRKEISTGHAIVTVRCTTRQKATLAFLVGLQRLLAALGL